MRKQWTISKLGILCKTTGPESSKNVNVMNDKKVKETKVKETKDTVLYSKGN